MSLDQNQPSNPTLLFVVGTPRSGTSLLQTLLACHPDACPIPESYFISDLTPTLGRMPGMPPLFRKPIPVHLSVPAARRFLANSAQRRGPGDIDWARLLNDCTADGRVDAVRLARTFFYHFAAGSGSLVVEKTPTHVFFIHEIRSVFPEAHFVQIVRDPRDVVCSFAELLGDPRMTASRVYALSRAWTAGVEAGLEEGIPFVRYEDLVTSPIPVVEALMRGIGLTFEESHLQRQAAVSALTRPSEDARNMRTREQVTTTRIGRHRDILSVPQQALVEAVCRAQLARFGYVPTAPAPARATLLRHRIAFTGRRLGAAAGECARGVPARIRHSLPSDR